MKILALISGVMENLNNPQDFGELNDFNLKKITLAAGWTVD